jgi:hypothetical protein
MGGVQCGSAKDALRAFTASVESKILIPHLQTLLLDFFIEVP